MCEFCRALQDAKEINKENRMDELFKITYVAVLVERVQAPRGGRSSERMAETEIRYCPKCGRRIKQ